MSLNTSSKPMNGPALACTTILTVTLLLSPILLYIPTVLHQTAAALSFGPTINVSETSGGDSSVPQIAVSGENVYVLWQDDDSGNYEILLAISSDGGITFSDPVNISNSSENSLDPQFALGGSNGDQIFVVWREVVGESSFDTFFSTGSQNGTSFSEPVNLSNTGNSSFSPRIAAAGDDVYIVWEEGITGTAIMDVYFVASSSGGSNFGEPFNLSNSSSLKSTSTQIHATDGGNVYVVWQEFDDETLVGDAFFAASTDGGDTFTDPPINLSGALGGRASSPQLSVSGSNVYIVWGDALLLDTFLSVSTDGGDTFTDPPINISTSGLVFNANPDIATFGNNLYAVWQDEIAGLPEIFFVTIRDAGANLDIPINVSNSDDAGSFNPRIALSETDSSKIYVTWQENNPNDIFFAVKTGASGSFSDPVNLSNTNSVDLTGFFEITASTDHLHVVWEDGSIGGQVEILSRTLTDSGIPGITIESVSNPSPKWGLDSVTVSGTVNSNATDTIAIEWGDGTSDLGIQVMGSSWGPIFHTYDSQATGTRQIVAKLLAPDSSLKASASSDIEVQKHATNIILNDVFSVVQGADITVAGTLRDTDTDAPIESKTITFSGSGVTPDLSSAITQVDGTYSSFGSSPDLISGSVLTVQAHFAGDSVYEASDSNIEGYDTVANGTAQFTVKADSPSGPVNLTGFGASIAFDDVSSDGSIFVSTCTAPSSARYLEIGGMCLKISPALQLGADSAVHVAISYDNLTIPDGHTENDIDLFHEGGSGITDITESRDVLGNTVLGSTKEFSRFIGGVALHSEAPVGATRHQLFVGDNDLLFEFPELRQLSFSGEELTIGDLETIIVADPYGNIDGNVIDRLEVNISSSSDPIGIIIEFIETSQNTGIFESSFTLTTANTAPVQSLLRAAPGDEITAEYKAAGMPPFRVIINGVIEAGIAEVGPFGVPSLFNTRVDAFDLRLVDAMLGPAANVTVVMSYANFSGISDPLQLGIALMDETICLDIVSTSSLDDIDTAAKTITGYANAVGQFVLVLDDQIPAAQDCLAIGFPPGGSGGGPVSAGAVVLDSIAVARSSPTGNDGGDGDSNRSSGGSGGGGGSRSAGVTQTPSGSDVETSVTTESGTVTVTFESVEAEGGQLKVSSSQLSSFEDIFDDIVIMEQDNDERGIVSLDGATYSTAGRIFDIDASEVTYEGTVEVTVPYDEEATTLISGSETNVRLLHYDEETSLWGDVTISVDLDRNVVTGRVSTLSPFVVAVIDDGTFGGMYFEHNPTSRVILAEAKVMVEGPEQASISTPIKNTQRSAQTYAYIVQIVDSQGLAQSITWKTGTLTRGEIRHESIIWTPELKGIYIAQVFVWDNMDNPSALSDVILKEIVV